MGTKRIAIVASSTLMMFAGWMPSGVVTTVTVGTALVAVSGAGCSSGKAETRQDTRTETRTEDRVEERRD